MMVERYPNLKEEVGGLIPSCEISSLHDGKLARSLVASCALALVFSLKKERRIEEEEEEDYIILFIIIPYSLH
jgi:hypothetical protein